MSLIHDVPDEIKDWYKPETTKLKERDVRFFTVLFA